VPTPIETIRADVRRDLRDESSPYTWSDDEIDRAIARALYDYSLLRPRQVKTTKATTAGSRTIDISSMTYRISVDRVEFPVGQHPRRFQRFEVYGDTLTLLGDDAGNGGNAYIYWGQRHTIDGSQNTVDHAHHHIIALGAAAYAALNWSVDTVNTVNVGGPNVDRDYQAWGQEAMARFKDHLKRLARTLKRTVLVTEEAFYEANP